MLLQKHGSVPSGGDIALADCHHAQSVVSHTHKLTMTDIDHRCHSLAMSWWVYSHTLDMQMPRRDTNGHLVFACACSYVSACQPVRLSRISIEGKQREGKRSAQLDTHSLPIRCLFRISASLHTAHFIQALVEFHVPFPFEVTIAPSGLKLAITWYCCFAIKSLTLPAWACLVAFALKQSVEHTNTREAASSTV